MPKELKDIANNVMGEIRHGKIKMRPKIYFIIGSVLVFVGLILSTLTSIFLFGLMRFSLRLHGPMGNYRFAQLLDSFPWWAAVVAVLGLTIGLWLLRRYDFSYKINFRVILIGFVLAIVIAGFLVDAAGLNDIFSHRGCMNKIYGQVNCANMMK